jgi:hypothetical protein
VNWAIKVVWPNGEEEFLHPGITGKVALFRSLKAAKEQRDFMWIGMEGECQSINIVKYRSGPAGKRRER